MESAEHGDRVNLTCASAGAQWRYLLFWPVFLLRYLLLEGIRPAARYTLVQTLLDARIPFCEWFVIPYLSWHICIVGMHLYTFAVDRKAYVRYSHFLIWSMAISTAMFVLFPSCQNLRPDAFPRENLLTELVRGIYSLDTNTNVFPSEHVIGAIALAAAAWNTQSLRTPGRIAAVWSLSVLICLSTVFLKQHSVLDVVAAVPVCWVVYRIVYGRKETGNERCE